VGFFLLAINVLAALILSGIGLLAGGALSYRVYRLWFVQKVFWDNQLLFQLIFVALLDLACLPVAIHMLIGVWKELKRRYWTQ